MKTPSRRSLPMSGTPISARAGLPCAPIGDLVFRVRKSVGDLLNLP